MKSILKAGYKILGGIVGAWVGGALGILIGIYLLGGMEANLSDFGISINRDSLILLAIGSAISGLGGALGFRHPTSMAGANSVSL